MMMMQAQNVLKIIQMLASVGVQLWLDGGWGVDALLGRQTREHSDVDVVIRLDQVGLVRRSLEDADYTMVEDELPTRFVMQHTSGLSIDFHPVYFDDQGDGIQQLQDGTPFHYPADGFAGHGTISGVTVPCVTAEAQLLCHLGYEPTARDQRDMRLLGEAFQLSLPAQFQA
ncbi:aminoglycoside nucleotidyltransferase [Dictyobacter sp. S3.2.2.5]|uniref:Aminoglycoside nucleotidyltransferase n=1 Tax=Dictyobacter halimunensis TaxID=3026934 RepID=A0ABQ6FLJ7_9CHLR|nr:aminoglycoside nucleotidyltransferase [Dictyobacter sp. S3.2.2.5]